MAIMGGRRRQGLAQCSPAGHVERDGHACNPVLHVSVDREARDPGRVPAPPQDPALLRRRARIRTIRWRACSRLRSCWQTAQ